MIDSESMKAEATVRKAERGLRKRIEAAPDRVEARVAQAMETALRSKEKAHAFFVAALPRITDPQVKALFEELRDEEVIHQNLVKNELAKLPPGPDVDPDDYSDEPVAQ